MATEVMAQSKFPVESYGRIERSLDMLARHPRTTVLVSLAICTLLAIVDVAANLEVPLTIFYLPFLAAVAWVASLRFGAALATICSVLWMLDDVWKLELNPTPLQWWITFEHFTFFLIIISLIWRLRRAYNRQRELATSDSLTGLLNGKAFAELLRREAQRSRRSDRPLAIVMIDCDNFKNVNDTLGHRAGDQLLQTVGQTLRDNVRMTDAAARTGGDEFALLLPETGEAEATLVVARLQQCLRAAMASNCWPVTFSIGISVFTQPPDSVDELLHAADLQMYAAKRRGKDAVQIEVVQHS